MSAKVKEMWGYLLLLFSGLVPVQTSTDPTLAQFLSESNLFLATNYDKQVLAQLQQELQGSNDLLALLEIDLANEKLSSYIKMQTHLVKKFQSLNLGDILQKRQLLKFPQLGYAALSGGQLRRINTLLANMSNSYQHIQLCEHKNPNNCSLRLTPEVQTILNNSQDTDELEFYWLEWRKRTGLANRWQFVDFMQLYQKTAHLNGYDQPADYWFRSLELSGRQAMTLMEQLMFDLRPLFLQFHAHVRGSLRKMHGIDLVPKGKPYPQHLSEVFIGNSFGRKHFTWFRDLPDLEVGVLNITQALQRRGLTTTQRVFWNVAEFFRGLGLPQMESSLWTHAQPSFEMDKDRCWHKSWSYFTASHTNFTYCPLNDEERFFNMFEAQSELHYARAASVQPTILREEPFPHFSDAIGKCFSLAASSPLYLQKLGLLREAKWLELPSRLNRLYLEGLRVIFLLPVFYVLDKYRIEVLSGNIKADDNEAYWRLTEYYTGATAPMRRSKLEFDVPAKLLMEVDDQYWSHILSTVLQFQLLNNYCSKIKHRGPLDLCDLSDRSEIGPNLRQAMSLGSSRHYREVLQELLGEHELKMDGLLSYFQPLHNWLVQQNRINKLEVGWAKVY